MSDTKTSLELLEEYKKTHIETSNGYWRFIDSEQIDRFRTHLITVETGSFIPFAISVFGEILALERDKYVNFFDTPSGKSEVIASGMKFFLEDLEDTEYTNQHFRMALFDQAKEKHGLPKANQCYAFVPMLALGGRESVDNLDLCDWAVHLEMLL